MEQLGEHAMQACSRNRICCTSTHVLLFIVYYDVLSLTPAVRLGHSPLDTDIVRALLADPEASNEFSQWLRSFALMRDQPPIIQPYEILAEQHLAMDGERYLHVSRCGCCWSPSVDCH